MKNGRDHQGTPPGAFAWAARRWGPFDVDAAASRWNAKCPVFFDEKSDGLSQVWRGRVWVNPPWADINPWVKKAVNAVFEEQTAELVVMLLPVRGGRSWAIDLADRYAVRHPIRGRLKFDPPPGKKKGSGGFEDCAFYVFERPIEARDLMRSA